MTAAGYRADNISAAHGDTAIWLRFHDRFAG
jgi:hypothetical protein